MTAVASNTRGDSTQEPNGEHVNETGPSFTAVNGSSSPAPSQKTKEQPKDSREESVRSLRPSSQNEQGKSPAAAPEQTNVQHERRPSPPQEHQPSEDRPQQTYPHPHENIHDLQNNRAHTPKNQPSNSVNSNGVQKRKRDYPDEYDQSNSAAYHNHGLPPSPQRQRMYSQDDGSSRGRDHGAPENYGRPDRGNAPELYPRPERSPPPAENYPQPERHSLVRNEYDNRGDGNNARNMPYYSDARMAEALQSANNGSYEQMPMHENQFGSPDEDDEHQHGPQYGDYGGPPRTQAQRDLDRTRRKRVFSNRTKTGCMTCRRRKKKCDEQHPECKSPNCVLFRNGLPVRHALLDSYP